MQISLTRRQQEIYDYLRDREASGQSPPSLDQLCRDLGLRSRGSMHKHVQALVDAGLVQAMNRKQRGIRLADDSDAIPCLGYIAAGRPIEAVANPDMMDVPAMLKGTGEHFVLRVRGDSMIEEGILDGDWVVIERRNYARNGEIVVALVDREEATLKRIEQRPDRVVLLPANSDMAPMEYAPERVQIQGVLVGQMRTYR